jgi:hypothetical protein
MKTWLLMFIFISLLATVGCSTINDNVHPTRPGEPPIDLISKERKDPYTKIPLTYRNKYDEALNQSSRSDKAKFERNKIVYDLLGMIDTEHAKFMNDIKNSVAGKNILADFFVLGLNAAGAVTGGEAIKTILAVTSGAVVGANSSIDKNEFANNTINSIYCQMMASKLKIETKIMTALKLNTTEYPLEAALRDVWHYYLAGTLLQAVADLTQTTATKKTEADNELQNTQSNNANSTQPKVSPSAGGKPVP